jgi:CDP-diacylglycerol--serine O-phosphatidyltransferase
MGDSLRPNTTYKLDFADGIADNNEGNSLGNFEYVFSTGKELDSLADMLSFGFAPATIAFSYLRFAVLGDTGAAFTPETLSYPQIAILLSAFIISIFSGLRLAKFNGDTRQTSSFIGVPTPANALFWASLPIILHFGDYPMIESLLANQWLIIGAIIITSLLLVSEIPMFALKVKSLKWQENKIRYLFLITLVILAILLKWLVIPLILFVYIFFSLIDNMRNK